MPGEKKTLEQVKDAYSCHLKAIGLENLTFTYTPLNQDDSLQLANEPEADMNGKMPTVLNDLNLEIPTGAYVAFTGMSGCGKSTILKLLMTLYTPDNGQRYLLLDTQKQPYGIEWQNLFAYVPQGNGLMSGTIREIVAFSDQNHMYDNNRLQKALRIACADIFVNELEQGTETLLGEHGLGLSEGQMQRLAIARAVFSEHPILMLDECTSALDEVTESQVLKNMREMTEKTVLIVTHRPAALKICDMICEFNETGINISKCLH